MKKSLVYERVLPFTADAVWPVLSDTAGMNRKLGLAPMSFEYKDGVRVGHQKMLGTELEWTEEPWEWRLNAWLVNERVYRNGLFKSIAGRFALEPLGKQTRVTLSFTPVYRTKFWGGLLNLATKRLLRQLMDVIEATVTEQQKTVVTEKPQLAFATWLKQVDEIDRAKIAPKEVANQTRSAWQTVFREALGEKNLSLRFEAVCPHCRGAKHGAARLTELPEKVYCDSCEIEFAVNNQDSVEISFRDNTISPALIGMDFCSADVTHKPAIISQRKGTNWKESYVLAPGLYSLKKKGEPKSLTFAVEELQPSANWVVDELWAANPNGRLPTIGPRLTLEAKRLEDDGLVMLEQLSKVRGALLATEVLAVPEFVDKIPAESLVTAFPMEMGERSVLFTDVVGSTDMYFQIGDNAAFKRVRESFLLIGEIAKAHNGVLVKTIGDATMYAFMHASDALKTAMEIQAKNKGRETELRVTLHHGPCLSVGTRDGQDYFGDTINVCAKFQAMASADQVAFDRNMRERVAPEVWQELMRGHQVEEVVYEMKGTPKRSFELYRVTV